MIGAIVATPTGYDRTFDEPSAIRGSSELKTRSANGANGAI